MKNFVQKFDWGIIEWKNKPQNINENQLSVAKLIVKPKSIQENHVHCSSEHFMYILKGSGVHIVNKEKKNYEEGDVIYCPPYSEHTIINEGNEDLVMIAAYSITRLFRDKNIYSRDISLECITESVIQLVQNTIKDVEKSIAIPICFTDIKGNIIAKNNVNNYFLEYLKDENISEEMFKVIQIEITEDIESIYDNIIELQLWVRDVKNRAIGCIKCGYLRINRKEEQYKILHKIADKYDKNYETLKDYYNTIPMIQINQLYSLFGFLNILSKSIIDMLYKDKVKLELNIKMEEIIHKTKEMINLEKSLKDANILLFKNKYTYEETLINNSILKPEIDNDYPIQQEYQLVELIKKGNYRESKLMLEKIIEELYLKDMNFTKAKARVNEITLTIIKSIYDLTKDKELVSILRNKYLRIINSSLTIQKIKDTMFKMLKEIIDIVNEVEYIGNDNNIRNINKYIKNNYNNKLTLDNISEKFYLNPTYVSTLFNKINKISITDYINKIRIEKAIELIETTDYKISVISKKVGFSGSAYFISIFKKYMNKTPKAYRDEKKFTNGIT